jgi:starvation-inducible DNA-binding protein
MKENLQKSTKMLEKQIAHLRKRIKSEKEKMGESFNLERGYQSPSMSTQPTSNFDNEAKIETYKILSHLLADTYTLYIKTHNFHWNVTGPLFHSLHMMFKEQYEDLAVVVDVIAERIRALGFTAPGSCAQFSELASIEEETGSPPAEEMLRQLASDHLSIASQAQCSFSVVERLNDQASMDILIERIRAHEKTAWMLRSFLK